MCTVKGVPHKKNVHSLISVCIFGWTRLCILAQAGKASAIRDSGKLIEAMSAPPMPAQAMPALLVLFDKSALIVKRV
jgi:hypothetical protein